MAIQRIICGGGPKDPHRVRAFKAALLLALAGWAGWRVGWLPISWMTGLLYLSIGILAVGSIASVIWAIRTGRYRRIELRR